MQARCSAPELRRTATIPAVVHEVLAAPGRPLDPGTRTDMERRFGEDFGPVSVHDDARAAESAAAVHAQAYTVGTDVVFGRGRYEPGSQSGRRLLAHELAHVVQQRSLHRATGPVRMTAPGDPTEAQADRVADLVLGSPVAAPGVRAAAGTARDGALQRLILDGERTITLSDVSSETDVATLKRWKAYRPDDWEQDGITDEEEQAIDARIMQLQAPPPSVQTDVSPIPTTTALIEAPPDPLEALSKSMVTGYDLPKAEVALFLTLCGDQAPADALAGLQALATGAPDEIKTAVKAAVLATCKTGKLELGRQIAEHFRALSERTTIDVNLLVALIKDGAITAKKGTYRVESKGGGKGGRGSGSASLGNGSVFTFEVRGGASGAFVKLGAEWHVHWGPKQTPQNPGFKNATEARNTGAAYRRVTGKQENDKLKTVLTFG